MTSTTFTIQLTEPRAPCSTSEMIDELRLNGFRYTLRQGYYGDWAGYLCDATGWPLSHVARFSSRDALTAVWRAHRAHVVDRERAR
jgi:hypothetical protein